MNPEVLEHRNHFVSILVRDLPADRKKQIKDNVVEHINLLLSFWWQSSSFYSFIYLFIYLWLCWVFFVAHRLSLVGVLEHLTVAASLVAEHGL